MLAKPSLESLKRAIARAEHEGERVETIVVLDRADDATREVIAAGGPEGMSVLEVDFGDLGKSRNHAVQAAGGRYVAFLDADDLWGVNWLALAKAAADTRRDAVIWHPQVNVFIGAARQLHLHVDMEEEAFRPACLMIENCWTALSFAARDIYRAYPYPPTDLRQGFGFEDWAWNMTTIAGGAIHKVVEDTGHVIRRNAGSLSQRTVAAAAVPHPTDYLAAYLRRRGEAVEGLEAANIWSRSRGGAPG